MSHRWVTAAYETTVGPSSRTRADGTGADSGAANRKVVLVALADFADEDGYCWPRARTLAAMTELSESGVRKALSTLEEDGFIEVQEDYEPAGRQTSNVYRLLLEVKSPLIPRTRGRVHDVQGAPVRRTTSTRTPIEPSVRSSSRRSSAATAGTKPKRTVLPDDDTSGDDDEAPVLGRSGRRSKADPEVQEEAAEKGTTGFGLAVRLQRGCADAGLSGTQVHVGAVAKQLNAAHRAGQSREDQQAMVDVFCANPQRYITGDAVAWKAFLAAREKLVADANKHRRSSHAAFSADPYANAVDD